MMMSSKEERTTESADKGEKEHNDKRKCKWRECCNPERVDCDGYCEYHHASPGTDAQSQRDRQRSSRDRKRPSASPSDDGHGLSHSHSSLPDSAIATAIENIKDSDMSDEPSSTVSRGNDATSSSAADGLCPKCTVCKKRLARRNCLKQACIKCCDDPNCEPHREAREVLQKQQSILDGTDGITRAAAKKRASKVAPGMFFDSDIHYFGETVVVWDIKEFMKNQKWREDAMRRSRNRNERGTVESIDAAGGGGNMKRRRNNEKEEEMAWPGMAGSARSEKQSEWFRKKKNTKPLSRRRRFKAICDELYQKSLA
eukprot:CAMPEP_0181091300 /NCGR_PEP_ID=MMETSP1071-20121207/8325_1 /TAXON_ID=35127 /ORGANISM="Thalassiosira sp., Strain NH16" /LENGTH=312 /DNA_ID=CAMNT_0023173431 /DNA_START=64 /DNA_END=1002 /DNA_ORIENTATION=-